ncbi:MAG: hypothetical protein HYW09_01675 [Candidatus Niyogibacteria bacterium]|nr:hypothetical protein [Candidatus Niyogibacteria bacterium]
MRWGKKKNLAQKVIEPDEIFLDSANSPGFERELFEGRIEAPLSRKIPYAIFIIFLLMAAAAFAQLANLQIINHDSYLARAENNTLSRIRIPAERGLIYDRYMKEVVWNSSDGRAYWKKSGLAHVLGYIGYPETLFEGMDPKAKIGRAGIEAAYDGILRGQDGARLIEESASGEVLSQSVELEPKNGQSVILTIDADMQTELFSILQRVVLERGFRAASAVVLDVVTGEILSATSFPEFKSEVLSQNTSSDIISSYLKSDSQPFFFRAFEGLYAPGSVFKPIVALGALAEKIIDPARQILSTGSISIPNPYYPGESSIFYDWKAHGWVDLRRALAVSSNVYFYTVGGGFGDQEGLGVRRIIDYAGRLGLGKSAGVELPESTGFLPTPEWKEKNDPSDPAWRIGDTYNLSIGQGFIQVTPLQMAEVASAMAGAGRIADTHLVKAVLSESGEVQEADLEPERKINIPEEAFNAVRDGMRQAALYGTASALSGLGVDLAGKTGTAELGQEKNKVNSWFIGFMPYEKPKIALAIVLEAGNSHNTVGGVFVAREFILWLIGRHTEFLGL